MTDDLFWRQIAETLAGSRDRAEELSDLVHEQAVQAYAETGNAEMVSRIQRYAAISRSELARIIRASENPSLTLEDDDRQTARANACLLFTVYFIRHAWEESMGPMDMTTAQTIATGLLAGLRLGEVNKEGA